MTGVSRDNTSAVRHSESADSTQRGPLSPPRHDAMGYDEPVTTCMHCDFHCRSASEMSQHKWEAHPLLMRRKQHLWATSSSRKRQMSETSPVKRDVYTGVCGGWSEQQLSKDTMSKCTLYGEPAPKKTPPPSTCHADEVRGSERQPLERQVTMPITPPRRQSASLDDLSNVSLARSLPTNVRTDHFPGDRMTYGGFGSVPQVTSQQGWLTAADVQRATNLRSHLLTSSRDMRHHAAKKRDVTRASSRQENSTPPVAAPFVNQQPAAAAATTIVAKQPRDAFSKLSALSDVAARILATRGPTPPHEPAMDKERVMELEAAVRATDCFDPNHRSNVLPLRCGVDGSWQIVRTKRILDAWLVQVPGRDSPLVFLPAKSPPAAASSCGGGGVASLLRGNRPPQPSTAGAASSACDVIKNLLLQKEAVAKTLII